MDYRAIQRLLLEGALGTIRLKMALAPSTRYRASVTKEVESVLLEIQRVHGVTSVLPTRARALLLVPRHVAPADADREAVGAYVLAVALGAPVSALGELAMSTRWPDLMRRLARVSPAPDRKALRDFALVVEVMTE